MGNAEVSSKYGENKPGPLKPLHCSQNLENLGVSLLLLVQAVLSDRAGLLVPLLVANDQTCLPCCTGDAGQITLGPATLKVTSMSELLHPDPCFASGDQIFHSPDSTLMNSQISAMPGGHSTVWSLLLDTAANRKVRAHIEDGRIISGQLWCFDQLRLGRL